MSLSKAETAVAIVDSLIASGSLVTLPSGCVLAAYSTWQPIATAPKDGVRVLLLIDGVVIEGWWHVQAERWEVVSLPIHGFDPWPEEVNDPSHWMPLPALPPGQGAAVPA